MALPPDPRDFGVDLDEESVKVLHKMLAKSPVIRFQTPAELQQALVPEQVSGFTVECSNCHKSYRAASGLAGKVVKCKVCGHPIRVPAML